MRIFSLLAVFLCFVAISCEDSDADLPSFDDRVSEAIKNLTGELTAPANGWRLDYQPTPNTGFYYILMDFNEDGQVTIKSDLAESNGDFFEQTIPYRIDNALSLELILESYGFFHYLFEQNQSTFGAEFEFIFNGKSGDNLIFDSKSDISNRTRLVFMPAEPNAESLLSREVSENLNAFDEIAPQIFGGEPIIQQIILEEDGISIFWAMDVFSRTIQVDLAGVGTTVNEIINNTDNVAIGQTTSYILLDDKVVLTDPFTFTLRGSQFTVNELSLTDFTMDGPSLCDLNAINTPVYKGEITNVSPVTVFRSQYDSKGMDFKPMTENPYSVNVIFVFDQDARSLAQQGSIADKFPDASGFVFNYGFDSEDQPAFAAGLIITDEQNNSKTYLREFEMTETIANTVQVTFTDDFYYSETPEAEAEQNLREITDEIFGNGKMYIYDLETDNNTVFRLFNPCNRYELFLVQ
ncbi:DUF4302 domain-containing protein [Fulvivirga sp. M361]|uniref:DUF4302 domain-containing protein n=1 Tax=Fulvivirga sp. M361 TaxID=2594266 RepID=UPI00117BA49E|nr:DUF4302 domain-containing protein [Fulvivirga sp. M361]TRX62092.1 DUF4302 domain-containing protein [Fulvivirga sp. M361]